MDPPTQPTFPGKSRWGNHPHLNDENSTEDDEDDDDDGGGVGGGGGGLGIDRALRTAIARRMLAPLDIGLGWDVDYLLPRGGDYGDLRDGDLRDRRSRPGPVPPWEGSRTAVPPRPEFSPGEGVLCI